MARRIAADSPPSRRLFTEVALLGGGALLTTSSVIHLLLWSENYRDVEPLGQVLILLGVVGILLALALVRFGNLGLVLVGAFYLALSTAMLLIVSGLELMGYQEGMPAPYTPRSIAVPIVGLILLAAAAWLIAPPRRRPTPEPTPEPEVTSEDDRSAEAAGRQPLEPAARAPESPGSVERIRWPAQRPPMKMAEPVPAPPAPAMQEEPAAEPEVSEPRLVDEVSPEPEPQVDEEALPGTAAESEVAGEPEPQVAEAMAEHPTAPLELEAEPVQEPGEEAPPPPASAAAFDAEQEAVPEWIPEPLRSQLVREQDILERLRRALGRDDPGTLTTRSNIAAFYLAAGDVAKAALLQEGIAADSVRILGATHPHTRTAQTKAAEWRKLAKKRRRHKVPVSS